MQIMFKCCLCFSLVLCSHLVGYHLLHVEPVDLTLGKFSAKLLFSKNFDCEKFCSAKVTFGEISVTRNFPTAKIPSVETPSAKIPCAVKKSSLRNFTTSTLKQGVSM